MPLRSFSQRLVGRGHFVVGADAGGEVAVEVHAAQQRRMAVDMPALECVELGDADRVLGDDAGEIHELGKADDFRVVEEPEQVIDASSAPEVSRWGSGLRPSAW